MRECPNCGYAMDEFDETCRRCENRKTNPAGQNPCSSPPETTRNTLRLAWSIAVFCVAASVVTAIALWSSKGPSAKSSPENEPPGPQVGSPTKVPLAPRVAQPAPARPMSSVAPQPIAPAVDERKQFQDAAKAELARQEEHSRQVRQQNAAGLQPMYPARTQPPGQEWVPAGQTSGHWQYVGREPGSGDDSWIWVDSSGRRVGGTVSVRPTQ